MNIPVLYLSYDFSTIPVVRLTSCPWLPVHALQFLHPSVAEPTFIYRISLIGGIFIYLSLKITYCNKNTNRDYILFNLNN